MSLSRSTLLREMVGADVSNHLGPCASCVATKASMPASHRLQGTSAMSEQPGHVVVTIPTAGARFSYIRDYKRNDWRSDLFRWYGIAAISWSDKRLPVLVFADSKNGRSDEEGMRQTTNLLAATVSALMAGRLSAFASNDVTYDVPGSAVDGPTSIEAILPSGTFAHLESELEHHRATIECFDIAREQLSSTSDYGDSSDARRLFNYLEDCFAAGYLGDMHGWYQEKLARMRSHLTDLARRKNRSHSGYKAARDYVQSQLYSFMVPEA